MADAHGLNSHGIGRGRRPGGGSRDDGIRLLAAFPDVNRPPEPTTATATTVPLKPEPEDRRASPRFGWGSIAILLLVAAASCTAAWWSDRGPIDPGAVEIERARLAERTAANKLQTTPQKMTRRR